MCSFITRFLWLQILVFSLMSSVAWAYRVQNNHIIDNNQQTVHLYGVNWFGFETPDLVAHGLWVRNWKEMISQMKSVGFNAVRLPFCPETLQGKMPNNINYLLNPDLQGLNALQIMDAIILELDQQGLYVLLDHHQFDCKSTSPLWYTSSYSESRWLYDLTFVAKRYRSVSHFIGIDLKNEPHGEATWGTGKVETDWNKAAERAAREVLKINYNLLIFVEGIEKNPSCSENLGDWWGGNLEPQRCQPLAITSDKLVFSPHIYGPDVAAQPYFNESNFPANLPAIWTTQFGFLAAEGRLVIPGEFGGSYGHNGNAKDKVWQDALVNYFIDKGIENFFYWSWNPNSQKTGGILQDDWTHVWDDKRQLLRHLTTKDKIAILPNDPANFAPATAAANCKLDYMISNYSKNGLTARFRIQNTGQVPVNSWSVVWQYPQNVRIVNSWGANLTMQGMNLVASYLSWNQKIPVGSGTEFGAQLQFTGALPEPHFFLQSFICN
jgi:endoglucanase